VRIIKILSDIAKLFAWKEMRDSLILKEQSGIIMTTKNEHVENKVLRTRK